MVKIFSKDINCYISSADNCITNYIERKNLLSHMPHQNTQCKRYRNATTKDIN